MSKQTNTHWSDRASNPAKANPPSEEKPRMVIDLSKLRSNPPRVPQPSERSPHKIKRGL